MQHRAAMVMVMVMALATVLATTKTKKIEAEALVFSRYLVEGGCAIKIRCSK